MEADKALEIVLADVWRARGIEPSAAAFERLGELVESARRAWPALDLNEPLLVRFIVERASSVGDLDVARAPDWALASECARGSRRALAVVQAKLRRAIAPSVRKLKLGEADVESALQRVATDLFVTSPDRPAGITRYDGRGDLTGWLRVAAVRAGLKVIRVGDRHASVELEQIGERLPGAGGDPDSAYLKALYRPVFQRAFQEAFASLSPRDRTLLKQSLLDGLSIDVLGPLPDPPGDGGPLGPGRARGPHGQDPQAVPGAGTGEPGRMREPLPAPPQPARADAARARRRPLSQAGGALARRRLFSCDFDGVGGSSGKEELAPMKKPAPEGRLAASVGSTDTSSTSYAQVSCRNR